MIYYRLINDSNHYFNLRPIKSLPSDWVNQFDGNKYGNDWQPIKLCFDKSDNDRQYGDFPHFAAHLPGLSERAWKILKPFIDEYVEPLQVDVESDRSISKFYLLNVICVLDALDKNYSNISYFDADIFLDDADHILKIDHYVFNEKNIGKTPIFRIKNDEIGGIYVNELIRDGIEKNQLKGFLWRDLP